MYKNRYRKQIYPVETVLNKFEAVKASTTPFCLDGDKIKKKVKYHLFLEKGIRCAHCGIEGLYFAKEKFINENKYHLNLYGKTLFGKEVVMTIDHIKPKSKGGRNHFSNYQTMCYFCNNKKGNGEQFRHIFNFSFWLSEHTKFKIKLNRRFAKFFIPRKRQMDECISYRWTFFLIERYGL